MERFFSSLKTQRTGRMIYRDQYQVFGQAVEWPEQRWSHKITLAHQGPVRNPIGLSGSAP
jgi:hypothetical protein